MICVEAEAAEEAAADGRRGEDLKTRTPHNDVGKKQLSSCINCTFFCFHFVVSLMYWSCDIQQTLGCRHAGSS